MKRYNPAELEPKWQKIWDETEVYKADLDSGKPKYIGMSMFNYPSGAGIHIGHAMNYTISDVMARYKRQAGYESYHPVGWDAFGLPAENFAIKSGVSPQQSMAKIIPSYHEQYKAMGWSNDWSKEISTHEPAYYKWTQWIFSEMYRQGLAYQDARQQWWCDKCQTVLANEQVINDKCWRHDGADDPEVVKREVKQWFFKITDYADELLEATDALDWTDTVKLAQKNWIGRSVGAEVEFAVAKSIDGETERLKDRERIQAEKLNFVILHGFTGRADKNFIPKLKDKLEKSGYNVQAPQMPNTDNPREDEQVAYVLDNCTINENTVLIGHSLGGAVAMKVVQKLETNIHSLVLVAPVIEPAFRPDNYKNEKLDKIRTFVDTFDLTYDYDQIVAKTKSRIILSDTGEKKRKPYLEYLAPKIDAKLYETTASKVHFTGENEPLISDTLNSCLLTPDSDRTAITVFTTRPDTLFGATFLVLAPEHEMIEQLTTDEQRKDVEAYVKASMKKSELERQESKEKTGVFTGSYAVNPMNGEQIPVWIADYVLVGYGTGAIMAVPAHDERDNEFAKKFDLPIISVVEPTFGAEQGDDTHKESIYAVLRNPEKNEVLILDWGPRQERHGGNMLIGGGVGGDEALESTAIREIAEETGYTNIKFVAKTDFKGHGYFYSNTKNKNMHVSGYGLLYDLVDETQEEAKLDEGEKNKFTVTWQPVEKVAGMLDDFIHETMYRYLVLGEIFHGDGILANSAQFDGVESAEARDLIIQHLEREGKGRAKTTYKLRDWSVSRQRYWGAPIPIVHCPKDGIVLVPDAQLPVVLPELKDFAPSGDGRSALARATEWLNVECPTCGGPAERETDTLDTYICSSWYELRYFDPKNSEKPFDPKIANKWMPIDFYNGGDHATAHLLYVRFIAHFFHRLGMLDDPEPFKKFLFNGKVTASDGTMFSKSKGNGIDPLEIINQGYGADALRTYLMFAAPLEFWARWDPQGVPATHRFLSRIWNLTQEFVIQKKEGSENKEEANLTSTAILRTIHPTIKKVTEDLEDQKYNTAIAAMMKCVNELYEIKAKDGFADHDAWQFALESLVSLVAPFAPHIADELWHELGRDSSVQRDSWPVWNDTYLVSDTMKLAVQINGKVRAEIEVPRDADKETVEQTALENDRVKELVADKPLRRIIYVPGRIVNIVL